MSTALNNQSNVNIQLGLFDSIIGLLSVNPIFLFRIIAICIMLIIFFKNNNKIPKMKISILSLLLYYYLFVMLANIVGIPTFSEYIRLSALGENLFNPNINLIPFNDGFSLSFILNILLFIPLGFLCPLISKNYQRIKSILLIVFILSFSIEISQLFTLYRATDINDLITNIIGTIIGYCCFNFIKKLKIAKSHTKIYSKEVNSLQYIPIITIVITFVFGFFS